LDETEYLVFHNYFVFVGNLFFLRDSRVLIRSVFVINVSLFTSVVCWVLSKWITKKTWKMLVMNLWNEW